MDYEGLFDWNEANAECQKLGGGWRLPTLDEMDFIYDQLYKNNLGHFENKEYWCSNEDSPQEALYYYFDPVGYSMESKMNKFKIRPVRQISQ